jgi:hypothetical protein
MRDTEEMNTGYVDQKALGPNELQHGEIVRVILLEEGFPLSYEKEIAAKDKKEIEKANKYGLPFKPNQKTYKDGGLSFRYAVVTRDRLTGNCDEYVFSGDSMPNFKAYGAINYFPWPYVFAKGYNYQKMGAGTKQINKAPEILNYLPDAMVATEWENGKAIMTADKIPAGFEEQWETLLAKEKLRQSDWKTTNDNWNKMSEEEIRKVILRAIARKYAMCVWNEGSGKYEFVVPEKGTIFQAKVTRQGTSLYFDLAVYEWQKGSANQKGKFVWHSDFKCLEPDEDTIATADRIIKIREDAAKEREEKKKKLNQSPLGEAQPDDNDTFDTHPIENDSEEDDEQPWEDK